MGVPTVPLTELYSVAGDYISARGGEVRFRSSVESFRAEFAGVKLLLDGGEEAFDFVVLAVPFDVLSRMLPQTSAADPLRQTLARFRDFADHRHSSLVRSPDHRSRSCRPAGPHHSMDVSQIETAGAKSSGGSNGRAGRSPDSPQPRRRDAGATDGNGSYVELVVSSSKTLVEKSRTKSSSWRSPNCASSFPARAMPTW